MNHYSNPTENAAIGSVERELRQMQKWTESIWLFRTGEEPLDSRDGTYYNQRKREAFL